MTSDSTRPYQPTHTLTPTYLEGMKAIADGRLNEAIEILAAEPVDSPCYGLALGNAALGLIRLDRREDGEVLAEKAAESMKFAGCPHPPSGVQILRNLAEAISGQGRSAESLPKFNIACATADALMKKHPEFSVEIELEKAHTLNSWGAAQLQLRQYAIAVEICNQARAIYQKHADSNTVGIAEVLTNCSHAYRHLGKFTEAELSLIEALICAKESGSKDQIFRTQLALIQTGSPTISEQDAYTIFEEASVECEASGRFGTAYLRRAIAASWAAATGRTSYGLDMITKAKVLEIKLDASDPNPPRLRMTEAQLLIHNKASSVEIVKTLTQGANLWYSRLGPRLIDGDVFAATSEMHEHFRLLAQKLLELGKIDEAIVAFEAGRAISYAIEVDPNLLSRIASINPFSSDGVNISVGGLKRIQHDLASDEVILILSVLPPDLTAFVIGKDAIVTVSESLPDTVNERRVVFEEIAAIPGRLHAGKGVRAIPALIQRLATQLASNVGSKKITAIMPYSILHAVTWRMVLRDAGIPWVQLRFGTEFGLMLRLLSTGFSPHLPGRFFALGSGKADTIDLNEEARIFAAAHRSSTTLIEECTHQDLSDALRQDAGVLISCHGSVNPKLYDGQLVLELHDGDFPVGSIFPSPVKAPFIILSSCESGVYEMHWSDYPLGAAPDLIRLGAVACIGTRFSVGARFSAAFIAAFSSEIKVQSEIAAAFCESLAIMEQQGADRWRDLACLELLVRRK